MSTARSMHVQAARAAPPPLPWPTSRPHRGPLSHVCTPPPPHMPTRAPLPHTSQLTLLALFHLLDFGSGHLARPESRRQSGGRDWREALQYGLLGLHLGGTRLDSHKLK